MPPHLMITTFLVNGLDCTTEEKLIREQLADIAEIKQLDFNFISEEVTIHHKKMDIQRLLEKFQDIQMPATIKTSDFSNKPAKTQKDFAWLLLGISALLALIAELGAYHQQNITVLLLSLLSIGISGPITFKKGLLSLGKKTITISSLMLIAITGALLIGEWPEAAMVSVLFAIAEKIEHYSINKARNAIKSLIQMTPPQANVKNEEGFWQKKSVETITSGTMILIKPGERIPLDGLIITGQSTVNQSPITGESFPIAKASGDTVYAGTLNQKGALEVHVTHAANDSLLAKITRTIEEAHSLRAPTQRFVDVFSTYYTPIMVLLAILIAIIPPLFFNLPFEAWIYKALTLLIIACPCALVISTPITVVSGLATAAHHGLLIKGGAFLENGHLLRLIALDKTGTLTQGYPSLTDSISLCSELNEAQLLLIAASLESYSEHPIAQAFNHASHQKDLLTVLNFEAIPGYGIKGLVDKTQYFLGNHQLISELGTLNANIEQQLVSLEKQSKSTLILSTTTQILAIYAVSDPLRDTSKQAIDALHRLNIKTAILSGDNALTAHAIAKSLNIDEVKANLKPNDKLTTIDQFINEYTFVGMVGDGINDAPALAKASISFAMGRGTDTALEIADITLMNDNLMLLPLYIQLSRKTSRILKQNIGIAIIIKCIFFIMAMLGITTLWMAVFADMGASLIVIINGLRLLYFKSHRTVTPC